MVCYGISGVVNWQKLTEYISMESWAAERDRRKTGQIIYVYKTYKDFVVNMVSANRRKKCDGAHNRSSARVRWRHFTSATRILQAFAFFWKLGLLYFELHWDYQMVYCGFDPVGGWVCMQGNLYLWRKENTFLDENKLVIYVYDGIYLAFICNNNWSSFLWTCQLHVVISL